MPKPIPATLILHCMPPQLASFFSAGPSVIPKMLEPLRSQLGIPYRVLDVPVPEVRWKQASTRAANWKRKEPRNAGLSTHTLS